MSEKSCLKITWMTNFKNSETKKTHFCEFCLTVLKYNIQIKHLWETDHRTRHVTCSLWQGPVPEPELSNGTPKKTGFST